MRRDLTLSFLAARAEKETLHFMELWRLEEKTVFGNYLRNNLAHNLGNYLFLFGEVDIY